MILDKIYEGESNEETRALQTTINQRNALLDVIIHLLLETCTSGKMNTQYAYCISFRFRGTLIE